MFHAEWGGSVSRLWFLCSKSFFCCQSDETGLYSHLSGVPKALLPGIGGKKILDFWWETVNMCVSMIHTWSGELSCSPTSHWWCLSVSTGASCSQRSIWLPMLISEWQWSRGSVGVWKLCHSFAFPTIPVLWTWPGISTTSAGPQLPTSLWKMS